MEKLVEKFGAWNVVEITATDGSKMYNVEGWGLGNFPIYAISTDAAMEIAKTLDRLAI